VLKIKAYHHRLKPLLDIDSGEGGEDQGLSPPYHHRLKPLLDIDSGEGGEDNPFNLIEI
jgi:hypothetical protein